jgi:hypothetical protein
MPELGLPKQQNVFSMWWSYHKRWGRYWRKGAFHRLGKVQSHVLSALAAVIGAVIGVKRGWISSTQFWPVLLTAAVGYIVLILLTWIWQALFVSSRIDDEQQKKIDELESELKKQTHLASDERARYLRRSTEITGLQQELMKVRAILEQKNKELRDVSAAYTQRLEWGSEAHNKWVFADNKRRELERLLDAANAELESLRRPDDCPIISIFSWGAIGSGAIELLPHGFYLNNSGQKPAYEVTIQQFQIGEQQAASSPWNEIRGGGAANAQIPVGLVGVAGTMGRFDLLGAFNTASKAQDGDTPPYGRPNFPVTVHIFYRDHRDLWYESIVDVVFVPPHLSVASHFEFKFVRQNFLGRNRPNLGQNSEASA